MGIDYNCARWSKILWRWFNQEMAFEKYFHLRSRKIDVWGKIMSQLMGFDCKLRKKKLNGTSNQNNINKSRANLRCQPFDFCSYYVYDRDWLKIDAPLQIVILFTQFLTRFPYTHTRWNWERESAHSFEDNIWHREFAPRRNISLRMTREPFGKITLSKSCCSQNTLTRD